MRVPGIYYMIKGWFVSAPPFATVQHFGRGIIISRPLTIQESSFCGLKAINQANKYRK